MPLTMERVTFNGAFSTRRQVSDLSDHLRRRDGDSEISIFDAEKYFNESGLEQRRVRNRASPVNDWVSEQCLDDLLAASPVEIGYGRSYLSRSFHATPTSSSEASWNSQTGLLTYPPGAVSVRLRNANQVKKRGWLFGRKCPCSGEKSVQVEDRLSCEPKTPGLRLSLDQTWKNVLRPKLKLEDPEIISISRTRNRGLLSETRFHSERVSAPAVEGFTFPILGPPKPVLPGSVPARPEESPRDSVESVEVFGPLSPKSRLIMAAEDDMGSDASSDLFEIESFSTATTNYPVTGLGRDSLDEAASLYCRRSLDEPSEASIDWSVTTAEGFERGSLTNYSVSPSEFEEALVERGGRRRGNVLSSCRCEKAVSVGPQPQPVGKWVSSTKHVGHVGGRAVGQRKPPSGSARLSLALATRPQ